MLSVLSCLRLACCGAAALAGSPRAVAEEAPTARAKLVRPALANSCAVNGAGFVPVAGSGTCIKVSGHVRVEYGWGNPPPRGPVGFGLAAVSAAEPGGGLFGRLRPESGPGRRR